MIKVLLVSVGIDNKYGAISGKANQNRIITPMLSIPYIAAMISKDKDVDIEVIDEMHGLMNLDHLPDADIVGLSGMTMHINRVYRLADVFRKRGSYVVLGGIHVSFMVEEALTHGDTVICGEGEISWSKFLEDYKRQAAKRVYMCKEPVEIRKLPRPRLDLVKGKAYERPYGSMNAIMASRGCPNNCTFCCVKNMFGRKMRYRDVEDVCEEISEMNDDLILFADDNMVGNPTYAKKLFKAMKPLNKTWGGQVSITLAKDEELLKMAAESGCKSLFIGIESINTKNLELINKTKVNRVDEYSELIKKIRSYGIEIFGSFIVGLDEDDEATFNDIYEFVIKNDIKFPAVGILTPFPGTELYQSMQAEDRIFEYNWDKYNLTQVVFRPKNMEPEELQFMYDNLIYNLNISNIAKH